MLNEKIDCIACLKNSLTRTAKWREKTVAPRFGDQRNIPAAAMLRRLAEQADALTDADWSTLQVHFGWASERWNDAVNEASRMVGFKGKITDFAAYLRALNGLLGA
jgi:hypothetical protein